MARKYIKVGKSISKVAIRAAKNYNALRKGAIPTLEEIDRLYAQMESGKTKSVRTRATRELFALEKVLARRANERMRSLEKAGLESSPAYRQAAAYLETKDRKRFSENKLTKSELFALRGFLGSSTSTLRGAREATQRSIDTLRERIPQLKGWTDREIKNLQQFLGYESVSIFLSLYGQSKDAVEKMAVIIRQGEEKELKRLFAEYQKYLDDIGTDIDKPRGLSNVQIQKEFSKLYESIDKRKR